VTTVGQAPSPRAGAACAVHNEKFYVCGGHNETGILGDIYYVDCDFESSSVVWHKIATMGPSPQLTHATFVQSIGTMYLFGGYNGQSWNVTVNEFDATKNKWLVHYSNNEENRKEAENVAFASFTSFKNHIYLFGGTKMKKLPNSYVTLYNIYVTNGKAIKNQYPLRTLTYSHDSTLLLTFFLLVFLCSQINFKPIIV